MIYDTTFKSVSVNENSEEMIMSLLENADDRFEDYTIAEASAIIIGEQEANWTNFMEAVGFSELGTIMDGEKVVYEGTRLSDFVNKAIEWFEAGLKKLAQLTSAVIKKLEELTSINNNFLKKYEKKLNDITIPSDFTYSGYEFKNMDKPPEYDNVSKYLNTEADKLTKEFAQELLVGNIAGESMSEKLEIYFYGKKEKTNLKVDKSFIKEQLNIIRNTKKSKEEAKRAYKNAAEVNNDIIRTLKKNNRSASGQAKEINTQVINFWKTYSNCVTSTHNAYMRALTISNRQALSICTAVLRAAGKKSEKKDDTTSVKEGFVTIDTFLGAVEFI